MTTKTFVKINEEIQAFQVEQIIFDESDLVSMRIKSFFAGSMRMLNLLFTFKQFNDMLRCSGKVGEKIQDLLLEKMDDKNDSLYIINLDEQKIMLSSVKLNLSLLSEEDSQTYCVEEISPLSFLAQVKNLKNNIRQFNLNQIEQQAHFEPEMLLIAKMYKFYMGLLSLHWSKDEARKKAGLENNKLFYLAALACEKNY